MGPSFLAALNPIIDASLRHLIAIKCMRAAQSDDVALRTFSAYKAPSSAAIAPIPPDHTGADTLTFADFIPEANTVLLRDLFADQWIAGAVVSSEVEARSWASQFDTSWLEDLSAERIAVDFKLPLHRVERLLRPAAGDLAYFSLPDLAPDLDLALTLLARRVMKHFARRVIGLELSSPQHLYQNILAGTGFIRDTGQRLEIELPSPPLAAVLSLSGLLEETYSLPWLQGREICLLPLRD